MEEEGEDEVAEEGGGGKGAGKREGGDGSYTEQSLAFV